MSKKTVCGFAFILFGIAVLLAAIADPYYIIITSLPFDHIGVIGSLLGLIIILWQNWRKYPSPKE